MLENTSEGILTIDTESQILYANPAIERILGYRPEDLVGSSKMKIIPERLRPAHETGLEQYLQTGEKHVDWNGVDLLALHKDGHEVPVSVSLREHEYRGQLLFTGIFTDVSEQKQREQRLRDQKQQLKEFADILAHDLRNPLTVAKGHVELLPETADGDTVDRIESALDRMKHIIDDTLQQAHNGEVTGTTEVMPFDDVVRMAWGSVPTAGARLVLPDPSWEIRAQEGCLRRLLENLVRNAVDHAGSDVTVRVGIFGDGEEFYVEDDGPGVPEAVRVGMETPSGLTRDRDEGCGSQVVERVAEEHGWRIRIADASGGGARIEFCGVSLYR
jgi:PAS domain S-box-containing protein